MWLAFNDAFVSVVQDKRRPEMLMVRARKRKHLKNVVGDLAEILETPNRDYRWRAFVTRKQMSTILAARFQTLDYGNFKDSVEEHDLHEMYMKWWFDHNQMQRKDRDAEARSANEG